MVDTERFVRFRRKADNVNQKITAADVNIIQRVIEHNQLLLFEIRDKDFKQECQYALEHHPGVNVLWFDLMQNTEKLDLINSSEVKFDEAERAVVFDPDSTSLTGIVYSKPYININNLPIKNFILLGNFYIPPECSIKFQVSNNGGQDFFEIDPLRQNPITELPTDGYVLVIRAEMTRLDTYITPRIDSWALLYWDLAIANLPLPDGTVEKLVAERGDVGEVGCIYDNLDPEGGVIRPIQYHYELPDIGPNDHHAKNHHHGQGGIDLIDLGTDVTGVLGPENLPPGVSESVTDHNQLNNIGTDDHHTKDHQHGQDGVKLINLETDITGILPLQYLPPIGSKGVAHHDALTNITENDHHPKSHRHGQDNIPKVNLAEDIEGILDKNHLPPDIGDHKTIANVGPDDHHPKNHHHGQSGVGLLSLETDVTGVLDWVHLPFTLDEVGGGISVSDRADAIKLGTPLDGSWQDGVMTWTEETKVARALDDLNELMLDLVPQNAGAMGSILTGGPQKYTGKLSGGLTSYWYSDGKTAGQEVNDIVLTVAGIWTIPTFNFADTGLLSILLDETKVATLDLGVNFNEDNRSSQQDISTYNNQGNGDSVNHGVVEFTGGRLKLLWVKKYEFKKWQIGSAQIELDAGTLEEGVHTLQVTRELLVPQQTGKYQIRLDKDNTNITISEGPIITENTVTGKYLSGVKFYTIGDSFNISYKCVNAFKNTYHPTQVGKIEMPGLNTRTQNPPAVPQSSNIFMVSETIALDKNNVIAEDVQVTVTVQDPYGKKDNKQTPSENRLVMTQGAKSNDKEEYFCDEAYRLPLDFDFESTTTDIKNQWDSSQPLTNGNAQYYIVNGKSALVYPVKNFSTCLPANTISYNGFTGNQVYARAFIASSGQGSITITLEGLTGGLDQVSSGDVNLEIKLPGKSGWGDALKPFDSAVNKSQNGWGMLSGNVNYSGEKATLTATFGGLSTIDCSNRIYMRITLRNSIKYINSIKIGW